MKNRIVNEFLHYLFGTLIIIFGGHWLSDITGLEAWAITNGVLGYIGLFVYYLTVYILVDQILHLIFDLN